MATSNISFKVSHGDAALIDMGGSYPSAAATGCHECRRCRAMLDDVFPPPKV